MSFNAQNDRIWISDTNGQLVFDTNNDMPCVTTVIEANVSKLFDHEYYHEEYFTIGETDGRIDFMICRAECTPTNMWAREKGKNAFETAYIDGSESGHWVNHVPTGDNFFQGSMLLESGYRYGNQSYAQYARRALHVSYEPSWGDKIVCMFQQGVRKGYGSVGKHSDTRWYWIMPDGSFLNNRDYPTRPPAAVGIYPLYKQTAVTWDVKLKIWAGRFR